VLNKHVGSLKTERPMIMEYLVISWSTIGESRS